LTTTGTNLDNVDKNVDGFSALWLGIGGFGVLGRLTRKGVKKGDGALSKATSDFRN